MKSVNKFKQHSIEDAALFTGMILSAPISLITFILLMLFKFPQWNDVEYLAYAHHMFYYTLNWFLLSTGIFWTCVVVWYKYVEDVWDEMKREEEEERK